MDWERVLELEVERDELWDAVATGVAMGLVLVFVVWWMGWGSRMRMDEP